MTGGPIRLAVLAHSLRAGGGLAVGRGILEALTRLAPSMEILAVVPEGVGFETLLAGRERARVLVYRRRLGSPGRYLFDEFALPRTIREFRPQAILSLNGRGLTDPPAPQVLFPQNAHLFYPRRHYGALPYWRALSWLAKRRDLRKQLGRAALVLAQTEVVARRLRDELGYRGRTLVCGSAVGPGVASRGPHPRPAALGPKTARVELFAPAIYLPHKNLERIADAYALPDAGLADVRVVTTVDATHHPLARRFLERLERARGTHGISNVGEIPRDEMAAYYEHSDALLMPSLIETVGLPYLEAMHFGKPILTSDLDFAREVCGDAAEFFDPFDARALRHAIARFRDDPARRSELAAASERRGRERRATWDDVTRVILDGVASVASRSS